MSEQILVREGEGGKRIRPDVLQTALLDDIAFRISSLENVVRSYIQLIQPEGKSIYEEVEVRSSVVGRMIFKPLLFSLHVWNDGPDDVFVAINRKEIRGGFIKLKKDEDTSFKYNVPVIKVLYYYCREGEAADIRLAGVY